MREYEHFGKIIYKLFAIITVLIAVVNGYINRTLTMEGQLIYMGGVALLFFSLLYAKRVKRIPYMEYIVHIIIYTFSTIGLGVSLGNIHIVCYLFLLQCFLSMLFMEPKLCGFQVLVSSIFVIAIAVLPIEAFGHRPSRQDCVFIIGIMIIFRGIIGYFVNSLKFNMRRIEEQERSLDDMIKVIEAKCFEARNAYKQAVEQQSKESEQ